MKKESIIVLLSVLVIITSFQLVKVSNDFTSLVKNFELKISDFSEIQRKNIPDTQLLNILNEQIEAGLKIVEETYILIEKSSNAVSEINSNTTKINEHIDSITKSNKSISLSCIELSDKLTVLNKTFSEIVKENQELANKLENLCDISAAIIEETKEAKEQIQKPAVLNLIRKFKELEDKK